MLLPESIVPADRYGLIYLVTHRDSGKQYVGQTTVSLGKRWTGHTSKARHKRKLRHPSYIASAIAKHGADQFTMEVLDWAMSKESLDHREDFWISFLDTMDHAGGYNLKDGGAAGRHSPEVCARIAKTLTGRKLPVGHPFTIKGKTAPMKGRTRKAEWNATHGATMKAKYAAGEMTTPVPGKPVFCVELDRMFPSVWAAAQFVHAEGRNARNPNRTVGSIGVGIRHGLAKATNTAYGYHWQRVATQPLTPPLPCL